MTFQELHDIVYPKSQFNNRWSSMVRRLNRRNAVLKHGFNCGRRCLVLAGDKVYIVIDEAYESRILLEACSWFNRRELQICLEAITEHAKHDNQYIETNFKCNG